MSHAYTSYTTICCGNRKMAERIELIFTMETDSPELDGSPKDEGLSFLPSWGKVRCICLCLPKCSYVHRITYVLAYQSTISSIRFHILLFVFSHHCFMDVQSADDAIHIDVALLPIRCCIVVVLWYFQS